MRRAPIGMEERHYRFVREYLIDMDHRKAAQRAGYRYPAAGMALMRRVDIQLAISSELQARSHRLQIDADAVLSALIQQLARLTSMLGQDIGMLYSESGGLKPISEWPAIWRERLVTEISSEDTYERSSDGVQAGESKAWDKSGQITKIKRESTLAIEKQIRETLREIGEHVNVKAFQQPQQNSLHVHLNAEITSRLNGALARESKLLSKPETEEE